MSKQVLLINDLAGYGKVALSAMIPALSYMGHHIYNLPTALVSNTLDYGKFHILETTDYMENTMKVWEELGFQFDAISTGFIVSERQAKIVSEFCQKRAKDGVMIFADPIMGDEGKLYNGVSEQTISHMKSLVSVADYIVPNYTEAACLADMEYSQDISEAEAHELIDRLRGLGAKSVIVTSARVDGQDVVVGFNHKNGNYFTIPFEYIPTRFPGTGDIFSAVVMGKLLEGQGLEESTKKAMDVVHDLIENNKDNDDKFKGIPLESCLEMLR